MKRLSSLLAACVAAAAPSWAQTDADRLTMDYVAPAAAKPVPGALAAPPASTSATVAGCALRVRNAEDVRRNKDTVGAWLFVMEGIPTSVPIFGESVFSGDGTKWLNGAVRTLPAIGLPLRDDAQRQVDLQLRLAHVWVPGLNMSAQVVLEARYPQLGDKPKRYHGFATKLNWANGKGEHMETLNLAMHDALKGLADDVNGWCAGVPITAFVEPPGTIAATPVPAALPPVATVAVAPVAAAAQAPAPAFMYRVTDRTVNRSQTVGLRTGASSGTQLGELDVVTPPGGWSTERRKLDYGKGGRRYELEFIPGAEETLTVAGQAMRAVRIEVDGWLQSGGPNVRGRYRAQAWYAPQLARVVRFEVQARSASSSSGTFHIDEAVELVGRN